MIRIRAKPFIIGSTVTNASQETRPGRHSSRHRRHKRATL